MEKTNRVFPGDQYAPSRLTKFLWWLSTAEEALLKGCVIDRNRYSIVGMSVLGTWLFATLAWTYFFSTVNDNPLLYVLLGIFMGGMILSIDRALIKGINRRSKNKITALAFRVCLAVTIGSFMAQPALLYLFRSEIRLQTSIDNEAKRAVKKQSVDSFYKQRLSELIIEKNVILQQQDKQYQEVSAARNNYIAETDGSGGSGKVGLKAIAQAKKAEYEKLDAAYQQMSDSNAIQLKKIDIDLANINSAVAKENTAFEQYFNNGFLTQIEALNNLIKTNTALQLRYYLLLLILVLIELMPVIAKSILPEGSYEEKVRLQEAMEISLARNNAARQEEMKEQYAQLIHDNNKQTLSDIFDVTNADKKLKMTIMSQRWKEDDRQSYAEAVNEMSTQFIIEK